jgi:hypothetical protein
MRQNRKDSGGLIGKKIIIILIEDKTLFIQRSNLYFGLKHRSAKSLSGGLMWFDYHTLQKSRDRFLR